jgi:hypothetical protein
VDSYSLAVPDPRRQQIRERQDGPSRWRYTAIRNGKGNELDCVLVAKVGFALQPEFGNLLRFEQADNQIVPAVFQPATSSASQSPARGRGMTASRPGKGVSTQ